MRARWHIPALLALAAAPVAAAPVEALAALPDGVRVIDIRAEDACTGGSQPGARCLPAAWLFAAEGGPIDFWSLRWLLGTLGLTGAETVAVFPADAPDATAAVALLYLAGQAGVVLLAADAVPGSQGETRSFSREAVFTAPMRLGALAVADAAPATPLTARLDAFARGETETVAFGPAD